MLSWRRCHRDGGSTEWTRPSSSERCRSGPWRNRSDILASELTVSICVMSERNFTGELRVFWLCLSWLRGGGSDWWLLHQRSCRHHSDVLIRVWCVAAGGDRKCSRGHHHEWAVRDQILLQLCRGEFKTLGELLVCNRKFKKKWWRADHCSN